MSESHDCAYAKEVERLSAERDALEERLLRTISDLGATRTMLAEKSERLSEAVSLETAVRALLAEEDRIFIQGTKHLFWREFDALRKAVDG